MAETIFQSTTVSKLLKVWPEIEPYIPKNIYSPPPAVSTALVDPTTIRNLNARLGIPEPKAKKK